MEDDVAERLDNLDLAVTQIADAVEVLTTLLKSTPAIRYEFLSILDQLEKARELIGTGDPMETTILTDLPAGPTFD